LEQHIIIIIIIIIIAARNSSWELGIGKSEQQNSTVPKHLYCKQEGLPLQEGQLG
jgi:hypothetical protein